MLCWGYQGALLHAMIEECVMIWLSLVENYASVAVSQGITLLILVNFDDVEFYFQFDILVFISSLLLSLLVNFDGCC